MGPALEEEALMDLALEEEALTDLALEEEVLMGLALEEEALTVLGREEVQMVEAQVVALTLQAVLVEEAQMPQVALVIQVKSSYPFQ